MPPDRIALVAAMTLVLATIWLAKTADEPSAAAPRSGAVPADQIRPVSQVRIKGRWRTLQRRYADWAFPTPGGGPGCSHLNEDFPGDPPPPFIVQSERSRLSVRFRGLAEKPKRISVSMWRSVASDGSPEGEPVDLKPRNLRRGATPKQWRFWMRVRLDDERFFFLRAQWPRNEGCGPRQVGDTFRTRPG